MKLQAIWVYPLKSAGGLSLDAWDVDALGLVEDRRFMLVGSTGRFMSQRTLPPMAKIVPEFKGELLSFSFPNKGRVEVPRKPDWSDKREVEVWGDKVLARRAPEGISHWFRLALERDDLELVWFNPAECRQVDPKFAGPDDRVGFADGFPLLLTNEASLKDLNERLESPVPMNRFRPNLVVDGEAAFDEDDWREIRVGELSFRVAKPCARCQIPNIDQVTGEKGKEPMRTLSTFRKKDGAVIFGQNLIHDDVGTLAVGDALEVY